MAWGKSGGLAGSSIRASREAYQTILTRPYAVFRRTVTFERLVPLKNGDSRFVRITYTPDVQAGEVVGYFGLIHDISEQHRAEKALRDSDERYRAFIEQSSEGIWRFELEEPVPIDLPTDEKIRLAYEHGYLAECNDAMARQYGLTSAAEIKGARWDLLSKATAQLRIPEASWNRLRIIDAESHEHDTKAATAIFLTILWLYRGCKLIRAWGTSAM